MKPILPFVALIGVLALFAGCASRTTIHGVPDPEPKLKPLWTLTDPSILNPESAYFDSESNTLYVSNVAGGAVDKDKNGWITKVDVLTGKVTAPKWVTGLNAPKGIRVSKGTLWVSDIDQIVSINVKTGKILKRLKIWGAKFLNDVAVGPGGEIYFSDMVSGYIYVVRDGRASVFVKDPEAELPNGLFVKGNSLIVSSWGIGMNADFSTMKAGNLASFDLKTKRKTLVSNKSFGNLDGLESDGNGGFFVTDWMVGKIYRVDAQGAVSLIDTDKQGVADIGYIPATKTLIVPQMNTSQIRAYTVQ